MNTRAESIWPAVTKVTVLIALAGAMILGAGCGDDGGGGVSDSKSGSGTGTSIGTIDAGTIRVAIRGDLPFAAVKDGELTGVDGDIMRALGKKLGQKLKIETMDFSGQLGAIESGRVDVAIGSIGWNKDRTKAGIFTDPAYYAGATIIQREGSGLKTLDDLEGKTIGTVTGYAWVPAIKSIPGARLRTYDSADAVYADVGTGRIDAAFVDTLQDIYTAHTRPELRVETTPLEVTPEQLTSNPAFAVFGKLQLPFYLPRDHKDLEAAMTKALRSLYSSGELTTILSKWNLDPALFLTPAGNAKDRIGVDRPDGWQPPSI
jgi:polar amino acid transport system substrate-binding protein